MWASVRPILALFSPARCWEIRSRSNISMHFLETVGYCPELTYRYTCTVFLLYQYFKIIYFNIIAPFNKSLVPSCTVFSHPQALPNIILNCIVKTSQITYCTAVVVIMRFLLLSRYPGTRRLHSFESCNDQGGIGEVLEGQQPRYPQGQDKPRGARDCGRGSRGEWCLGICFPFLMCPRHCSYIFLK